MKKPKVSVVVPVYNVEQYLAECVESILNQTLKEIEVILIDDGSPDNCGKMIDKYAKNDPRVVALHQKNSGYSKTINRGIAYAHGEYIGIVESDDWIERDMYEALYENAKANRTDVTKALFSSYNSHRDLALQDRLWANPCGIDLRTAPEGVFTAKTWPKIVGFHASIWSSIYRADFVKKIKVPESTAASYQDFPFMIEAMVKAKRITVVKKLCVHWRNEPTQIHSTSSKGEKLMNMAINSARSLEIIRAHGLYDELKEAFFAHAIWANWDFFYRISIKHKRKYHRMLKDFFAPIFSDSAFRFRYFRPEDYRHVQFFKNDFGLFRYYGYKALARLRHFLARVARFVFPSYRIAVYNKKQIAEVAERIEGVERRLSEKENG